MPRPIAYKSTSAYLDLQYPTSKDQNIAFIGTKISGRQPEEGQTSHWVIWAFDGAGTFDWHSVEVAEDVSLSGYLSDTEVVVADFPEWFATQPGRLEIAVIDAVAYEALVTAWSAL